MKLRYQQHPQAKWTFNEFIVVSHVFMVFSLAFVFLLFECPCMMKVYSEKRIACTQSPKCLYSVIFSCPSLTYSVNVLSSIFVHRFVRRLRNRKNSFNLPHTFVLSSLKDFISDCLGLRLMKLTSIWFSRTRSCPLDMVWLFVLLRQSWYRIDEYLKSSISS